MDRFHLLLGYWTIYLSIIETFVGPLLWECCGGCWFFIDCCTRSTSSSSFLVVRLAWPVSKELGWGRQSKCIFYQFWDHSGTFRSFSSSTTCALLSSSSATGYRMISSFTMIYWDPVMFTSPGMYLELILPEYGRKCLVFWLGYSSSKRAWILCSAFSSAPAALRFSAEIW